MKFCNNIIEVWVLIKDNVQDIVDLKMEFLLDLISGLSKKKEKQAHRLMKFHGNKMLKHSQYLKHAILISSFCCLNLDDFDKLKR